MGSPLLSCDVRFVSSQHNIKTLPVVFNKKLQFHNEWKLNEGSFGVAGVATAAVYCSDYKSNRRSYGERAVHLGRTVGLPLAASRCSLKIPSTEAFYRTSCFLNATAVRHHRYADETVSDEACGTSS